MSSFLVRCADSASSLSSSSGSSSSSAAPSPMVQTSREVHQYACQEIEKIIMEAIDLNEKQGTPIKLVNLPTEDQLLNLAERLVQFVRKSDELDPQEEVSKARINSYLTDAAWIHVGDDDTGTGVLMLSSHKLGEGGECEVFSGLLKEKETVAVKVRFEETDPAAEIEMFRQLSFSPYIIKRLSSSDWYQIEELCSKGSLHYISKNEKAFLHEHLNKISEGILGGIAHFHERNIIYADTKLENILITETGEVRFSDLGKSYYMQIAPRGGTHVFFAPEQILRCTQVLELHQPHTPLRYPKKGDVWQTMLTLAQINKMNLSQPFKQRLKQYRSVMFMFANQAERLAELEEQSGKKSSVANLMGYQHFMRNAFQLFEDLHKERLSKNANVDGLFSDLEPTTNLERLLIRMSCFDPRKRMDAHEAWEFFKTYCV